MDMTIRQISNDQDTVEQVTILTTERLFLREITLADRDFLVALHQDPDVMRYIGDPRSAAVTESRLHRIINYYREQPGYGIWMICNKFDQQCLGWGCLKDLDGSRSREIGYRLARQFWGHGYATEIARALRNYGFSRKRLSKIVAVTHPDNDASARVLVKTGLNYVDDRFFYNSTVKYFVLYRHQWRKGKFS